MRLAVVACGVVLVSVATVLQAGDWPSFRGPNGNGVASDEKTPTTWNRKQNVKWSTALPRPGNGSPIVVAGCVFVASAEDVEGRRRSLYCLDRQRGVVKWVCTVDIGNTLPTHQTNPYGGSTPVSDGARVVVWHASAGLHCYDITGKPLWSRDLGEFRHMWGYGTSPIIYQDRVILFSGPGKRIFVGAYRLSDGQTLWETEEQQEGDGEHNDAGHYMGSWSTPVLTEVQSKTQVIVMLPTRIGGFSPDNGELIWSCDGLRHERGDLAYSSPIIAGDLCFVTGGFRGPAMTVRLGGIGDVTRTGRLWRVENNPQNIGSGVHVSGMVYRPNADKRNSLQCIEIATGKVRWSAPGEGHWGSVVMAGGLLYATDQQGNTVVFRPNSDKYEEVASNPLGEPSNSTPAVSEGQLYIRTTAHLFCIGH